MSVDHFDYPELGLSVDRGKVGDPSVVTLDWVADFNAQTTLSNDGYERDRMEDVADGLAAAILHSSIKLEYPELVVVRRCA